MKTLALASWYAAASMFVAHAPTAAAEPENVLVNSGFERGTEHWEPDAKHELIRDATIARSGTTCLTGEVTVPDNTLRLVRQVEVRATNRYEFEIWAKATDSRKLVLWAFFPGETQRRMTASRPLSATRFV